MMYKSSLLRGIICGLFMLGFPLPAHAEPAPAAKAYLDQAIELIRQRHRYSAKADWPKIIAEANSEIGGAKTTTDTYPAIRGILAKLNEPHSSLLDPAGFPAGDEKKSETQQEAGPRLLTPEWRLESGRFGVVRLPELVVLGDGADKKGDEYTSAVRNGLIEMDKGKICGWIIDLRENSGGNMWPMLAGLDPLLGPSPFGAFLPPDGTKVDWVRANGKIFQSFKKLKETPPTFKLKHGDAPLAVLIGPQTASSGEMVVLSFVGRKNARLFGNPTAGYTSANTVHPLSDGAYLVLTESSVADRLGREYSGPIIPDEQTEDEKTVSAAENWLKTKCQKGSKAR
jgi:carboxyl-terminal processing protease